MNLDYNDEQTMLRDQIQKFCESEYDFYKREKIVKSTDDFDPNVWNLLKISLSIAFLITIALSLK